MNPSEAQTRERAIAQIEASAFRSLGDRLAADLRPSGRVRPTAAARRSRLGGHPLLPPHQPWPRGKRTTRPLIGRSRSTDVPLDFLAQIDFAELPASCRPTEAPDSGLLSFFFESNEQPWGFDPNDRDGFALNYFADSESLVKRVGPKDVIVSPAQSIEIGHEWQLPEIPGYVDFELDETIEDYDSLCAAVRQMSSSSEPESPQHRVFGIAQHIQNTMEDECQLVTSGHYHGAPSPELDAVRETPEHRAAVKDWILLLQLDTDPGQSWHWGDEGMLYVWIRRPDLAQRRFDRCWTILQCG